MNINDEIKARIEKTLELLEKVNNKTTIAYLDGIFSLKCDYETLGDNENACKYADMVIDSVVSNKIKHNDTKIDNEHLGKCLLSSYDTKARNGDFRAFCIALEWNRPIHKQFFIPRMKLLEKHGVIQGIQDLIDDKLDLLVLNCPPRSGKTTLGLFLQVLLGGMFPDESILGAGHSVGLIQSFYNEIMNIIDGEEYRYHEIFPNNKIVNKSAEYLYIDLNREKRFHTYNYVSIEAGGTGKVQAERLLYCDDLIKNKEQVNNLDVLEKLYYNYTSTIKDRKVQRLCKDGKYRTCPEIHICTPWSLHDVTSRVVQNAKDGGDCNRIRIVAIPCYDENGESNFMYDYGKGFDVKYYKEMEIAEDPVIFSAKYLMTPVERDGLVFNKDNVSFYTELPGEEPDRIVGYADVSHGGDDYFSLPIGYVYGNEIYIEDILFKNKFGGDDYIRPLITDIIIRNKVTRLGIEKNNGGDFFSTIVNRDLKARNYHCNITTHNAPTNKKKLDRIMACQNDIKGIAMEDNTYRVYFKSLELIKGNSDYRNAMNQLFNWNQNQSAQNRQHDDFPDSLAGLITNVLNGNKSKAISINASKWGIL